MFQWFFGSNIHHNWNVYIVLDFLRTSTMNKTRIPFLMKALKHNFLYFFLYFVFLQVFFCIFIINKVENKDQTKNRHAIFSFEFFTLNGWHQCFLMRRFCEFNF